MHTRIVVGTDGSSTARAAVERAVTLARANGATLHLVHAYKAVRTELALALSAQMAPVMASSEALGAERDHAESLLEDLRQVLAADGVTVEAHAVPCGPVEALLEVAGGVQADLIVVGSRGMQGARRVLGSVPNGVAHRAECDVLVVKTC